MVDPANWKYCLSEVTDNKQEQVSNSDVKVFSEIPDHDVIADHLQFNSPLVSCFQSVSGYFRLKKPSSGMIRKENGLYHAWSTNSVGSTLALTCDISHIVAE